MDLDNHAVRHRNISEFSVNETYLVLEHMKLSARKYVLTQNLKQLTITVNQPKGGENA